MNGIWLGGWGSGWTTDLPLCPRIKYITCTNRRPCEVTFGLRREQQRSHALAMRSSQKLHGHGGGPMEMDNSGALTIQKVWILYSSIGNPRRVNRKRSNLG